MPTVNINVAVTPKGKSISDGVGFAFTATPAGVVSSTGDIDLGATKNYPVGTAVTLAFQLTTTSLTFSSGPNIGTFPLSFFGAANGAKDALWLAYQGQNPGVYNGTEFVFPPNALGPGYLTLNVVDSNNDGQPYQYALWVWTALQGKDYGQRFMDDPRLVNHPNNK